MSTKPKQLSGHQKRKIKEKKDLEFKKVKGSLDAFVKKNNLDKSGMFYVVLLFITKFITLITRYSTNYSRIQAKLSLHYIIIIHI